MGAYLLNLDLSKLRTSWEQDDSVGAARRNTLQNYLTCCGFDVWSDSIGTLHTDCPYLPSFPEYKEPTTCFQAAKNFVESWLKPIAIGAIVIGSIEVSSCRWHGSVGGTTKDRAEICARPLRLFAHLLVSVFLCRSSLLPPVASPLSSSVSGHGDHLRADLQIQRHLQRHGLRLLKSHTVQARPKGAPPTLSTQRSKRIRKHAFTNRCVLEREDAAARAERQAHRTFCVRRSLSSFASSLSYSRLPSSFLSRALDRTLVPTPRGELCCSLLLALLYILLPLSSCSLRVCLPLLSSKASNSLTNVCPVSNIRRPRPLRCSRSRHAARACSKFLACAARAPKSKRGCELEER